VTDRQTHCAHCTCHCQHTTLNLRPT
jgi:hypothetical protein